MPYMEYYMDDRQVHSLYKAIVNRLVLLVHKPVPLVNKPVPLVNKLVPHVNKLVPLVNNPSHLNIS